MTDISYPSFSEPEYGSGLVVLNPSIAPTGNSPESLANALAARFQRGTEAIIQAGEIANYALRTFPAGSLERSQFFLTLVENGFLSRAEARAEGQSPKISKLSAIGENAPFLRSAEIISRLSPGYSNMYEAVQLLREARKHSADPEEKVTDILRATDGEVSRDFIVKMRKSLKQQKSHRPTESREQGLESAELMGDAAAPAELLLLTPDKHDIRRFAEDYANPDALTALRINRMVAKKAVALCIVETRDFPIAANRILPLAGFKYIKKVHLLSRPTSSEITTSKIAIVAARTNVVPPETIDPWESDANDDRSLATQMAPNSGAKLHAFADDSAPGWTCLLGGDVWSEIPSLKGVVS